MIDGSSQIAVRRRESAAGEVAPAVAYALGDHLDSAHVTLAADGSVVDRERVLPHVAALAPTLRPPRGPDAVATLTAEHDSERRRR